MNPIPGGAGEGVAGWPYPLSSVSPSSSSSVKIFYLSEFKLLLMPSILKTRFRRGGQAGEPLTLPRLPSEGYSQRSYTEPGAQKGLTGFNALQGGLES